MCLSPHCDVVLCLVTGQESGHLVHQAPWSNATHMANFKPSMMPGGGCRNYSESSSYPVLHLMHVLPAFEDFDFVVQNDTGCDTRCMGSTSSNLYVHADYWNYRILTPSLLPPPSPGHLACWLLHKFLGLSLSINTYGLTNSKPPDMCYLPNENATKEVPRH